MTPSHRNPPTPSPPTPDRLRAFVRWAIRRGPVLWLCALVVAVPAVRRTLSLYIHLKSDLEELLPRKAPSVVALDEYRERMPVSRYLGIVVDVGSPDDLERGEAFLDALAERIRRYPSDLVTGVRTGMYEERKFLQEHAALYVDKDELGDLRRRIEERRDYEIARRLDIDLSDEPPAPVDMSDLSRKYGDRLDPLDRFPSGRFSSKEERSTLLLVEVAGFSTGSDVGERLLGRVNRDIAALGGTEHFAPGLRVGFAGDIAITVEELAALRADLVAALAIVVVLVLAAIWAFYRWWPSIPILFLPLGLATTYAFAAVTLPPIRVTSLNSNTAFLGSVIIGNGINFGIILLARYREERAKGLYVEDAMVVAMRGTRVGTGVAAAAAAVSYGSLLLTQFQGFHQFGIIGGVGMLMCWCAAYLLSPSLIAWFDRAPAGVRAERPAGGGALGMSLSSWIARHARPLLVVAGLATLLSVGRLARFNRTFIESDFSQLRRGDNRQSGERYWGRRMDALLKRYLTPLVLLTDSPEETQELADRLKDATLRPPLSGLLDSVRSIGDLVPNEQAAKLEEIGAIDRALTPAVRQGLTDEQRQRVDQFFTSVKLEPITVDDLPPSMLIGLREKSGRTDRAVLVYLRPSRLTWQGDAIEALTRELRGAASDVGRDFGRAAPRLAGSIPLSNDIVNSILSDGPIAAAAALMGVIIIVLLIFRMTSASAFIVSSLLMAVLWLAATVIALGVKINFANFVAFPITFGIGVDYAVNMMARYRQENGRLESAIAATAGAVALASTTTIIGYGSLLFARNRGLFSFGEVAVLGEICCLASALLVLPALVTAWSRASAPPRHREDTMAAISE